jgi:uncharacterized Zn finger protein (UPF0148 family)
MQTEKAESLRKMWENKYCEHPSFEKEYYLSSDTGDIVCSQCGKEFTREQISEIEEKRKYDKK